VKQTALRLIDASGIAALALVANDLGWHRTSWTLFGVFLSVMVAVIAWTLAEMSEAQQ
jgi:hypothetical protein